MADEQKDLRAFAEGHGLPFAAECSGKISASQAVVSGTKAALKAVLVYTDGANDATVKVYDGTDATGKLIREYHAKATDGRGPFGETNIFVRCQDGIYVEISGTGAYAIVDYVTRGI